jgi:hypothetical protein
MIKFNRREFTQASIASRLMDGVKVSALPESPDKADETATAFVLTNTEGQSRTVGNTLVEREIRELGPVHRKLAPQGHGQRFPEAPVRRFALGAGNAVGRGVFLPG